MSRVNNVSGTVLMYTQKRFPQLHRRMASASTDCFTYITGTTAAAPPAADLGQPQLRVHEPQAQNGAGLLCTRFPWCRAEGGTKHKDLDW